MTFSTANQPRPAMIARGGEAVVISSTDHSCTFPTCKIWAQTGGNIKVQMADDTDVTFLGVADATMLDGVMAKKVYKVGTTAQGMVVLWG